MICQAFAPTPSFPSDTAITRLPVNVLVVDDNAAFCSELHRWIERNTDLRVVGEAHNGQDAVVVASRLRPDVILMDIAMPLLNGVEATRRIVAADPGIRVIALSLHQDEQLRAHMLGAGASAYLLKENIAADLAAAIRDVMGRHEPENG